MNTYAETYLLQRFFANFLILQDMNKTIISHITTKYSDTVFSSNDQIFHVRRNTVLLKTM